MKFEKNHQYFNIALYAFLVIAASMVFYGILNNWAMLSGKIIAIVVILQPVIFGFVLAYLLNPVVRVFDDKVFPKIFGKRIRRKIKRGFSILITFILTLLFLTLFISIVLPQLVLSITSIVRKVPDYWQVMYSWYMALLDQMTSMQIISSNSQSDQFAYSMIDKLMSTTQGILEGVLEHLEQLLPTVWLATTKITTGVLNAVVGIIISVYLLFDREKLFAQTNKLMTAVLPEKAYIVLKDIALETHKIFIGFIVGTLIDSVIVGIVCFIGMSIFQMDYAVLISVLVGVTNVIPYFGPFIGAIPGMLILYIIDPIQALWFGVFIFLLQQLDGNIIAPKILGDSTGLSAFWVIFSITLFSGIFGISGMFIGVPLFALIYSLTKRFATFLLKRKNKPFHTHDYDSDANPLLK